MLIPFFGSVVPAGFPSPAENYVDRACDLNDLYITNQEATYFVRVLGDSTMGDGIREGDVLVMNCSREGVGGKIVVAWTDGGNTVQRIHDAGELIVLMPSNPEYTPLYNQPGDE